jgi:hypothetical protein
MYEDILHVYSYKHGGGVKFEIVMSKLTIVAICTGGNCIEINQ